MDIKGAILFTDSSDSFARYDYGIVLVKLKREDEDDLKWFYDWSHWGNTWEIAISKNKWGYHIPVIGELKGPWEEWGPTLCDGVPFEMFEFGQGKTLGEYA